MKLAEQEIQRGKRPNSWQLAKHENCCYIRRLREVKLAEQGIQRGKRPSYWQWAKQEINFLL